jgi:hypothetical protein
LAVIAIKGSWPTQGIVRFFIALIETFSLRPWTCKLYMKTHNQTSDNAIKPGNVLLGLDFVAALPSITTSAEPSNAISTASPRVLP